MHIMGKHAHVYMTYTARPAIQVYTHKMCSTCHTDGEVVSKSVSDVLDQITPVGETIGNGLPVFSISGI